MSEQSSVEDLMKKIEDFERTIKALQDNVTVLKQKLADKKAQFGPDMNQWPKEK